MPTIAIAIIAKMINCLFKPYNLLWPGKIVPEDISIAQAFTLLIP